MSRPRLYSRHGCTPCKRRKKKCDEQRPVCLACQRLGFECTWSTGDVQRPGASRTRAILAPRVRTRITQTELDRIGFFHYKTLPLLVLCQPGIDWPGLLGSLMSGTPAYRNIVAAIGTQQLSDTHDADIAYQQALSSWRSTLADCGAADAPVVIFGCLLLIVLESMRGSAAGLRTHLQIAVKICNQPAASRSHHVSTFFGLLQTLCTSAKLYHVSPFAGESAQVPKLDNDVQAVARQEEDLQFKTQSAIFELIELRARHGRDVLDDLPVEGHIFRAKATQLKADSAQLFKDDPFSIANHANALLYDVALNAGGRGDVVMPGQAVSPFDGVVTLLARCVTLLHARCATLPFALGLDITQKLDLILAATHSQHTRRRALELLQIAPAHEGLWTAGTVEEHRSAE